MGLGCLPWPWDTRLKSASFSHCVNVALANEASWFIHNGSLCDWGSITPPDCCADAGGPSECSGSLMPLHLVARDGTTECNPFKDSSCVPFTSLLVLLCAIGSLVLIGAATLCVLLRKASGTPDAASTRAT